MYRFDLFVAWLNARCHRNDFDLARELQLGGVCDCHFGRSVRPKSSTAGVLFDRVAGRASLCGFCSRFNPPWNRQLWIDSLGELDCAWRFFACRHFVFVAFAAERRVCHWRRERKPIHSDPSTSVADRLAHGHADRFFLNLLWRPYRHARLACRLGEFPFCTLGDCGLHHDGRARRNPSSSTAIVAKFIMGAAFFDLVESGSWSGLPFRVAQLHGLCVHTGIGCLVFVAGDKKQHHDPTCTLRRGPVSLSCVVHGDRSTDLHGVLEKGHGGQIGGVVYDHMRTVDTFGRCDLVVELGLQSISTIGIRLVLLSKSVLDFGRVVSVESKSLGFA